MCRAHIESRMQKHLARLPTESNFVQTKLSSPIAQRAKTIGPQRQIGACHHDALFKGFDLENFPSSVEIITNVSIKLGKKRPVSHPLTSKSIDWGTYLEFYKAE